MPALAVCAFTAAGHDSPTAIADWASGCSQEVLVILGGRRDPWTRQVRPPCERTFRRVFTRADAAAFNDAVHGYLAALPQAAPDALPETTRHEREQRRAATQARKPPVPGLLPQAAADGKSIRGATRPDGSQVHPLSAFHVGEGRTLAQREVGAKTNEIPELSPCIEGLDLAGMVVTLDALHTQRETARLLRQDKAAHYLMIFKASQPTLLEQVTDALKGTDADFARASWTEEGKGHGRREKRSVRTAPADGIDWPDAAQVLRIHRDSGPATGHWASKEIAYGITSLAAGIANNRAEAIRWVLTRIRERPAYEQLREHTRDIEQLKSEF